MLSVIVVSFNTRELIRACLESLAADSPSEVWVVDNHSTDGSPDMVASDFPNVRLVRASENLGFAAANNLALRQTRQPYVCLLNPDTIVLDRALSLLVNYLRLHPDTAVAGPQLVNPDGSFQHSAFRFPGIVQAFLDLFPSRPSVMNGFLNGRYPLAGSRPFEIDHPLGACFVVRRTAIERVGLLDERYFMYCEEIDWCWRMKQAGWRIFSVPSARVVHYGGASTSQFREAMYVELIRSRLRLYDRFRGPLVRHAYRWLVRRAAGSALAAARTARLRGLISDQELGTRERAYLSAIALASG